MALMQAGYEIAVDTHARKGVGIYFCILLGDD
ncbi:hypothetical protein DNFV4_01494 [Nitrospira tepida]|uniref:Uncharacterized protein n=1 Tax=Nitrospira tepida TaxID=2973512 RepID=A0AA86MXY4_9BACT|nr:hypothetical protein DNFV4_01494 [Nitrospira tepida]